MSPATTSGDRPRGSVSAAVTAGRSSASSATTTARAAAGSWPHIEFGTTSNGTPVKPPVPALLDRLEALGQHLGKKIYLNSGYRSDSDQYRVCNTPPYPRPCAAPGTSNHRYGLSADVQIGGQGGSNIGNAVDRATLIRFGLIPLAGDPPHVDLATSPGSSTRVIDTLGANDRSKLYNAGEAHLGFKGSALATSGLTAKLLKILGGGAAGAAFPFTPGGVVTSAIASGAGVLDDAAGVAGDVALAPFKWLAGWIADHGRYAGLAIAAVAGGALLIGLGVMRATGYSREIKEAP